MEIPYTVAARPDTGLWNAKIGIWLFLASEVMLFGGLFSAYIFLRLDAEPGYWPHGLLNVPVGTMNTAILIASSVTVVLAWAALKMRQFTRYQVYMGITILCGMIFLVVKLGLRMAAEIRALRRISLRRMRWRNMSSISAIIICVGRTCRRASRSPAICIITRRCNDPNIKEYEIALDPVNADPTNPAMDRPHFLYVPPTEKIAKIEKEDVERATMFLPTHNTYFASYFTITGLHGLHVLGGVLVFIYMWLPVSKRALPAQSRTSRQPG